jgi:hypothetical protein
MPVRAPGWAHHEQVQALDLVARAHGVRRSKRRLELMLGSCAKQRTGTRSARPLQP